MTNFLSYLLASVGMTVLLVWSEDGPWAWFRERIARRYLPAFAEGVLDCYLCSGFWVGLVLSPIWWWMDGRGLYWFGCLMIPAIFWGFQHLKNNAETTLSEDSEETFTELYESRFTVCKSCEEFHGGVCKQHPCCLSTWRKFLNNPENQCPKGLF